MRPSQSSLLFRCRCLGLVPFFVILSIYACQAQVTALQFVPVIPCRVADTRNAIGPFGGPTILGESSRDFYIPQSSCGIPSNAAAYSLNVTVVPSEDLGYLTLSPSGGSRPLVSTLNSSDGRVKANAAIVPAGVNGGVNVFVTDNSDVVLDVNGYFVASSGQAFFALTPCRVFDSRDSNGPLGGGPILVGEQTRHVPVLSSNCGIPASAQAYSLNFTVIPRGALGFLTTWPTGLSQPLVSTLNAETGAVTANAAIVPAGNLGSIDVFVTDDTDVVIDADGYFAPPASGPNGLSLYTLPPCRVLDTRNMTGAFAGELTVPVSSSGCGASSNAEAFILNSTVVPSSYLGYLSLWPDGQNQPLVSTLNSYDGALTSNMAIVPTTNGSIDAYGTDPTNLILDISSFFASSLSQQTYPLSVASNGTGFGTITSTDGRINCGATCSASYGAGSSVTLNATPLSGSVFAGWSGGGCSGTGSCTVQVNAATNVTATFSTVVNSNMTWNVELGTSCSNTTYWRLFDENLNLLWPDATHDWTMNYINQIFTETISCTTGDTICLGASLNSGSDTTYWGVGINNTERYSGSLCQACGNYTVQTQTLTCP